MLRLILINQSFSAGEKRYLQELRKLFQVFCRLPQWKLLQGTINLILIDDAQIQILNQTYRAKNKPTDVLSFPYLNQAEIQFNTDKKVIIGEIFIARETAKCDAKAQKVSFQNELNKLLVHGVLHVLGFDHLKNSDFLLMQKKEKLIINAYQEKKKLEQKKSTKQLF